MKTVRRNELTNTRMVAGNEEKYGRVIIDGHVHNWVGMGWVDEGEATKEDELAYPMMIED